ncbi:hypothetical protein [Hymenobacter cellulosilyticus]|uniref:Uncharacterized protein n=1 Tax=Hymenobacter cellulosilyticus TaxID=2932248 RepID=A0A8T9Q3K8_9BACT|nr:hypothetical protein [Hymenobacter cellulosilyticus]UOQ70458.1 hypothetical protein MUN79_17170 [Hymenobacter cellulosilyticus]
MVVHNDRAYLFYFTHPGRRQGTPSAASTIAAKRSLIQVVELHYAAGKLSTNRDEPTYVDLGKAGKRGRKR